MSFNINDYDYKLDSTLIASRPPKNREEARLLIYNRKDKSIIDTTFKEFYKYIPKDTAIIFNDTKVIKARIYGNKDSGGKVELLLNHHQNKNIFNVFIKGKVNEGSTLLFNNNLTVKIIKIYNDGSRDVVFIEDNEELDQEKLYTLLEKIGNIPLPPYIKRESDSKDNSDYQTVFAKNYGAVAAPTASLHFSDELFKKIKENFSTAFVTLHVGAGTFKGVDTTDIREHKMHKEYYNIPKSAKELIDSNNPLLTVGTTAIRTVETYIQTGKSEGFSEIFLYPTHPPKRTNFLITNFHLPKTTLIMLVASMISRDETLKIYDYAIKKRYRFYSYGDAMMII